MNPPLAFCLGFAFGAIPIILMWSRHADRKAEEASHAEDAAYLRGYNRAASGKKPELRNLL